jgi:translation initiation factor IF-2
MTTKLKVYELAKELTMDGQHLVDLAQRLGIDVKNTMSVLGTEEVRTIREHHRKNKTLAKSAAAATPAKPQVTEKRVGTTVIRRRSAKAVAEPTPEVVEAPVATATAEEEEKTSEVAASLEEAPTVEASAQSESDSVAEVSPSTETTPAPVAASEAPSESQNAPTKEEKTVTAAKPVVEVVAPKAKRFFPSIIKKVATEDYLGAKVGPKVEKVKKEVKPTTAPKPGTPGKVAAGSQAQTLAGGISKRVKEVDFASPAQEVAKEAGKRRLLERQNSVFKSADFLKRELVHSTKKKKAAVSRPALKTQITTPSEHKRVVEMGDSISVGEFAKQVSQKAGSMISKLMGMGVTASINESIDHDTAILLAQELGFEVKQKVFKEEEFIPKFGSEEGELKPRGPVVTIMGHVDHGKTSLLDAIRKTKVAAGEAGGITQHVGAYTVTLPKGKITFVDTPGHEAFTAMRARGAKVTDLVILVVSAVDGVMPQTLESINHSKAANVPIIVAVNKIDLPDGNPDRIKQTLAGHGLSPEEWGGDTIYVPVSAKTGKGLDTLLESILLQAEMMELKANYDCPARGVVIESRLDKNRGAVASVLVQHGKLKVGTHLVSGTCYGKIRAMTSSEGNKINEALPGEPVEVLGLPAVPAVGDEFFVMEDEKSAKALVDARALKSKQQALDNKPRLSLEEMMNAPAGPDKELRIILKADVAGSTEALKEAFNKFASEKVKLKVLHTGTGGITESDVMLAAASQAVILGFNIRPDIKAQRLAEQEKVQIKTYSIIYDLLEDIKKLAEGLLSAEVKERVIGRAEVRSVFNIPKIGAIAGSAVIDGKVTRGCFLRLLRDNRVVYEGKLSSLKRFKEDVKEVATGFECGIGLENFNDLKLGDQFEAFLKEEVKSTL